VLFVCVVEQSDRLSLNKKYSIALSFYLGFAVADQSIVERLAIQLVNT
jgi:hypothetical protein